MDRRDRLLDGCPVATGLGLEFGPLANPVVRKADGRVIYVDYTDTDKPRHHDDEQAARILGRAVGGKHVDCHCSVWTSDHFARVIPEALRLRDVPLRIRRLDDPVPGTNEFLVALERF